MKPSAIQLVIALTVAIVPGWALACPACAARSASGTGTYALLAGMIAVPYTVSAVALRVIRKLQKDDAS